MQIHFYNNPLLYTFTKIETNNKKFTFKKKKILW